MSDEANQAAIEAEADQLPEVVEAARIVQVFRDFVKSTRNDQIRRVSMIDQLGAMLPDIEGTQLAKELREKFPDVDAFMVEADSALAGQDASIECMEKVLESFVEEHKRIRDEAIRRISNS